MTDPAHSLPTVIHHSFVIDGTFGRMGFDVEADTQARPTRRRVEGDKVGGVGRLSSGFGAADADVALWPAAGMWLATEDNRDDILD